MNQYFNPDFINYSLLCIHFYRKRNDRNDSRLLN